ncbi:MAG: hypothetical protein JRD93_15065 [Deltaproteobacteria bacterium]|nr:hypothetical protein [Deltaproteobacteria bacterium]MBW2663266.1 hypothetical protein [Deltaproteobacteria bacterium]
MEHINLYTKAHLFVSAIRIIEYKDQEAPSIENVCRLISCSLEQGNLICSKLFERGIINIVEGAYGAKLYIKNHLEIEEIPKGPKENKFEKEIEKFKESQKNIFQKVELFKVEQAEKQKNLFAELEKKLKEETAKK